MKSSLDNKNSSLTYISLFSSAGVGCYGFKQVGFNCVASVELLSERMAVQRANKKCRLDSGYIVGDILEDETKNKIFDEINHWKSEYQLKQVDVVFATPPCQGISTLNYKKNEQEQRRNSLVVEAIKLIKEIQPKIFVFENVRGFMKTICTDINGDDMTIADSITKNLAAEYHIYHKVLNFKDYGIPSSRPRTIVVGTLKSLLNISPLNIFPVRKKEISLRNSIGKFKSLSYGEFDSDDLLHFARKYPEYQEEWISELKEGQSAFDSTNKVQPYKISQTGERVLLKCGYMGNKYRRLFWDRPGACISTRNDQLASQDTIHPSDNRVLSIRELMSLMTIPKEFCWTTCDKSLTLDNIESYLKDNELNIRRCIGEAVPTEIVRTIAQKCSEMLDYQSFVENFKPEKKDEYLKDTHLLSNFYIYTFIQEQLLDDAKKKGAFYTPQCVVFDAIKGISAGNEIVRILEPAVGLGAFLPQIAALFSHCQLIEIDAVDIDSNTIETLQEALTRIDLGVNLKINLIASDFLKFSPEHKYDYVITNPPYAKTSTRYRDIEERGHKTKNLFALFLIKFRDYADEIICVIPKNFAIADEYLSIRRLYESSSVVRICDFGVKFFKKVFVEIISIHFSNIYNGDTEVVDYVNHITVHHPQGYLFHHRVWLLYRDAWFDNFITTLNLDAFSFFRDRQITNAKVKESGKIRVLKSKNILDSGEIVNIPGYDRYVDDVSEFAISKYLNSASIIMPNFTYNTRATILPDGAIPNGSIAILSPKEGVGKIDLSLYATADFRRYYSIVKSKSKFTLNIDNCAIYYIGVRKHDE